MLSLLLVEKLNIIAKYLIVWIYSKLLLARDCHTGVNMKVLAIYWIRQNMMEISLKWCYFLANIIPSWEACNKVL